MDPITELAEFDREIVAQAKAVEQGLVGIAEGANADAEELKGKVLGKNPFDPSIRADMGLAY